MRRRSPMPRWRPPPDRQIANLDYADYHNNFLRPPTTLMIDTGLWILLEATIGFVSGRPGLAHGPAHRSGHPHDRPRGDPDPRCLCDRVIAHMINVQRGIVGLAMVHLEPGGLPPRSAATDRTGRSCWYPNPAPWPSA